MARWEEVNCASRISELTLHVSVWLLGLVGFFVCCESQLAELPASFDPLRPNPPGSGEGLNFPAELIIDFLPDYYFWV